MKCASKMVGLQQNVCNYLKLRKNSSLKQNTLLLKMPCEMGNHGMQYIYQADKINGEISKPYKDVYYMNCRGSRRLIIGGGADIHIFVFTDYKNN